LTRLHKDYSHLGSSKKVEKELLQKAPIDPNSPCFIAQRAGIPALPYNPLLNGVSCLNCPYVFAETMRKYCGNNHHEGRRRRGRPAKTAESVALRWESVSCHRLFVSGFESHFSRSFPAEMREAEETMRRRSVAKTLSEADSTAIRLTRLQSRAIRRQGHLMISSLITRLRQRSHRG
jgi:hypothetical protein